MWLVRLALGGLVAAVLLAGVGALVGCGTTEPDRVRAKVEQFAGAAGRHDYAQICQQVLAIPLLEQLAASGISCEAAMGTALGAVSQPSLGVGRVTVTGGRARVLTLSTARGQQAVLAEIDLIREVGGWRISALGGKPRGGGSSP